MLGLTGRLSTGTRELSWGGSRMRSGAGITGGESEGRQA
jgi:hypothetical protein